MVWSSAACCHARTLVPSRSDVFPDHLCLGQVCSRANRPQAHLHHDSKKPARQQKLVDPQDVQVHISRFVQTAWQALQLKSRVATDRQLHTREFQHRSTMRFCSHQNLSNDKRVTILGLPCDNRQYVTCGVFSHKWSSFSQYSSCDSSTAVLTYECSTSRSSEFCTSGERGTWLELSLQWSQVSEFLLIKLVSRSSWKATIATEVVLGANRLSDRDFFMSSKPWTACSVIIRSNTALNNPPCRSTLPICSGALHSCLTDQDSHVGPVYVKKLHGCERHDHNSRFVANQPNRPTN